MMIENFTIKCDFHLAVAQSQCHLTCLFVCLFLHVTKSVQLMSMI